MRDFLTGVAILLIVVLTTMLVAPYLVEWNGQRGFLENQLTRALGQTVTIGGNIDLKLLPTPYLRLSQTVIGGDDGPIRVSIHRLDLELSVAPLLHGEFDIVEGRLDAPTIRIVLQPDRTLPAVPDAPAFRADVRLERIKIVDGTCVIADPRSGRTFVIDHLDGAGEAASLAGPFKGTGSAGSGDARTKFRLSTTEASKDRSHVHFALDETVEHPALALDGDLALMRLASGMIRPAFAGTALLTGHLNWTDDASVPWRVAGPVKADPENVSMVGGEFKIGSEGADLTFHAGVALVVAESMKMQVALSADQLDINRLAGPPVHDALPPPPRLPDFASLRRNFARAMPPLPITADIRVDAATWGGEPLSGLAAHVQHDSAAPAQLEVSGSGPGGLHLSTTGTLTSADDFQGRFELGAVNLPVAVRWLDMVSPGVPDALRDVPFRTLKLAGQIDPAPDGLQIEALDLVVDRSQLGGSARLAYGTPTARARVTADLSAAWLDIDAIPDWQRLTAQQTMPDLSLKLDAGVVKVARVGNGPLTTGHLHLDLQSNPEGVVVNDFRADDLGGAIVRSKGTFDRKAAAFQLTVDASRLTEAAALFRQIVPGARADAFSARAASLAPAKLNVEASFTAGRDNVLEATRVAFTGTVGGTRLQVQLAPDRGGPDIKLTGTADAPQASTLLNQLGFASLPLAVVGPSHVSIAAHGRLSGILETEASAAFGSTNIAASGRLDLSGDGRTGSGAATLKSADAGPLLQVLSLSSLDMTTRLPVDLAATVNLDRTGIHFDHLKGKVDGRDLDGALTWQNANGDAPRLVGALDLDRLALADVLSVALGPSKPPASGAAWSNEPFTGSLADPPRSRVDLRVKTLDLGVGLSARDAVLTVGRTPDLLSVTGDASDVSGGHIDGGLSLRRDGQLASIEASLSTQRAAIDLPALKGLLTARLAIVGSGKSALALVTSLAGSGDAVLDNSSVAGADDRALPRIVAKVEDDTLAADDETIRRAFEEMATDPLATGTRRFALNITGGKLSMARRDRPLAIGAVATTLDASFDFRQPRLDVRLGETLVALPRAWSGPAPSILVTQSGPPDRTKRGFDVSAFVGLMATRAIARESARIASYEFDIRERALFNARLQSDLRRVEDQAKAETDAKAAADAVRRVAAEAARKADADRRAKADAARRERERQDNAATSADQPASAGQRQFQAPGSAAQPFATEPY